MISSKPFVGRDRELGELEKGLDSARGGRGAVYVLAGEPGIGKTRLADELAERATASGVRVLWGRCWETGPAPAYWPWIQVLRELGSPLLEGSSQPSAASTPDVESARFRLHDAVFRALKAATETAPLVVILDDLHAADADSLSLLLFVARNARALKLLLVCTTREAEVAARPALEAQLMRIGREGTRLPLKRLSRDDVSALLRQLSAAPLSDAAIAAVFRSSDGTPLYVDEALRLLEARGPEAVEKLSTEVTAREVLNAHLQLLPPKAHAPLRAAAVIGREFSISALARLLGTSDADAARALAPAEKARVVAPAAAAQLRFAHVLLQEALYESLEPKERSQLHEKLARALEHDEPRSIAAHHALRALPEADARWVLQLAERAAREAEGRLAYDAAADLYSRARSALGQVHAPQLEPDALRLDLLLKEAACRSRLGAGAEGRQLALEAAALARRSNDAVGLARAALTLGAEFQIAIVSQDLIALLEEAQRVLPPEHKGLHAQLLARHAAALQPAADPYVPVELGHRALALARQTGDEQVLQATLYSACSAFGDYEEPDVRAPLNRQFTDLARRHGDLVLAHRGLARLAIDLVELGRLFDCELLLAELEELARRARTPHVQWRAPLVRSMLAAIEGRFDTCEALLEEARALGAALDDWNVRTVCNTHAFALRGVSERPVTEALLQGSFATLPPNTPELRGHQAVIQASVTARGGDVTATREWLALALQELKSFSPELAMWLAVPLRLVGGKETAEALAHTLRTRRFEYFSWGAMGYVWGGPVAFLRGLLEAAQGNLATAEKLLLENVDRLRALHADGYLARGLLELARVRLERSDREGALPLLDEALTLAESLGQPLLSSQALALRGEAPRPAVAAAPAAAPVPEARFTLNKEGESWVVRHAGKTFHLRDTRGLHMLKTLLEHPGEELHALDLSGSSGEGAVDSGDAGELLDDTARARYRARAADLKEALEEAQQHNDPGRSARLRAELEFLEDELKRAFGLGGRARKSASAAERARVNVQRRIKDVLKKIEENDPVLAQHLHWAVKTGTFCSYRRS